MADRDHQVLRAADQLGVLVVEGEVGRRAGLADDPADVAVADDPVLVAEHPGDERRLGEDLRHAGVELAPGRAQERRGILARPGVELGEGRPVGGQEVRLRLGAQDRLAEVPGELLVGADRVRALAEDADPLRGEAEVDGGRVDEERAEAVADDADVTSFEPLPFPAAISVISSWPMVCRTSRDHTRRGPGEAGELVARRERARAGAAADERDRGGRGAGDLRAGRAEALLAPARREADDEQAGAPRRPRRR